MTVETKTVSQVLTETKAAFDGKLDTVREVAEKALAEAAEGKSLTSTMKELADEAIIGMNEAKARVDELEQKLANFSIRDAEDNMTAGERFTDAAEFKAFAGQTSPRGRVVVEVKDITSLTTDTAGASGALIQADRAPIVPLTQRRMTIRALLAQGRTSTNAIEYEREKLFTNNAAVVADGDLKPQSELQFEDATAKVVTIAHWFRVHKQTMDDVPAMQSIIDNRLRYGLAFKEEQQLLNGSGANGQLTGLVTAATAYAAPGGLVPANPLEVLRLMILQVSLSEFPANGIVINPIDLAAIELTKNADENYIVGNPLSQGIPSLWRMPTVETQAMGVDKSLVGAFDLAAQIFDRQDATVEVSTEDQDNFVRNKITIRGEERLALAIYRPQALVYGDLGRVV